MKQTIVYKGELIRVIDKTKYFELEFINGSREKLYHHVSEDNEYIWMWETGKIDERSLSIGNLIEGLPPLKDKDYSLLNIGNMSTGTQTIPEKNSKLREFFIDQLEDIYWAEQKLVKTLPKMANAAHSAELREAFSNHLEETKNHVTRIERAFSMMDQEANDKTCPAMKGITEEGEDIIDETEEGTAQRDVGLIFAGQKAEHYEIASYGGLVQLARTMHRDDVAELLNETLLEEKKADELLTQLAINGINNQAETESPDR